ncbi:MAG: hypothetical protein KTR29_13455 [Rhodothermaceae bacterium]|nr:hypothetical protein [Rhodothermaceae bacterium]
MSLLTLKRPLLQFKFEVRSLLAREPMLAPFNWPVIWWTQHKNRGIIDVSECLVGSDTEFVIDGFQGSGNSFATVAFKKSQTKPVRLAHHLHSPVQIIKAARKEIPVLLTIREPKGAAISLTSRWPYVSLTQAVRGYCYFYEKIEPHADSLLVSPFTLTTKHLDAVIKRVNERFATDFGVFEYSDEHMKELRNPDALTSEQEIKRSALKAEQKKNFENEVDRSLIKRAQEVYERLNQKGITL